MSVAPGAIAIEIRLSRASKTYKSKDHIAGIVALKCSTEAKHDGVTLVIDGGVQCRAPGALSAVEALTTGTTKPVPIMTISEQLISTSGRLPPGVTEVPFDIVLASSNEQLRPLLDTYHGVLIAVQYFVRVDVRRTFPNRDVTRRVEIFVESTSASPADAVESPVAFTVTHDSMVNRQSMPKLSMNFRLTGRLDSARVALGTRQRRALVTGEFTLHACEGLQLRTIDARIVRVESWGAAGADRQTESSEVQCTQLADGPVCTGLAIPIRVQLPAYYTCSTCDTPNCQISFELHLIVLFADTPHTLVETVPLTLVR